MYKIVFLCFFSVAYTVDFEITNKEIGPIWVGIQGNSGKIPLVNGGFVLGAGATVSKKLWRYAMATKVHNLQISNNKRVSFLLRKRRQTNEEGKSKRQFIWDKQKVQVRGSFEIYSNENSSKIILTFQGLKLKLGIIHIFFMLVTNDHLFLQIRYCDLNRNLIKKEANLSDFKSENYKNNFLLLFEVEKLLSVERSFKYGIIHYYFITVVFSNNKRGLKSQ